MTHICPYCGSNYDEQEGHSCWEMRSGLLCPRDPYELTRADEDSGIQVKVEWYNAGEGISGDYDIDDPSDINLLRFDISKRKDRNEWETVDDASYCTQVPYNTPEDLLIKGLEMIMDEIFDAVVEDRSIKKACERMSWISPESIKSGIWDKIYKL